MNAIKSGCPACKYYKNHLCDYDGFCMGAVTGDTALRSDCAITNEQPIMPIEMPDELTINGVKYRRVNEND